MTPNLFISFQLSGTFQKILSGKQGIPPKPAADLGQGTLYLLFPPLKEPHNLRLLTNRPSKSYNCHAKHIQ